LTEVRGAFVVVFAAQRIVTAAIDINVGSDAVDVGRRAGSASQAAKSARLEECVAVTSERWSEECHTVFVRPWAVAARRCRRQ
jgi:hypothetical protein